MPAGDLTTPILVGNLIVGNPGDEKTGGVIQQLITAMSRYVVTTVLNRRAIVPATFTDKLDGNGSDKLFMRDWPITSVASLKVFGSDIPASPDGISPGYVFDDYSLILLPNTSVGSALLNWPYLMGHFPRARLNIQVTFTAGYTNATTPPADAAYNGAPSDLGAAVTWLVAQEYKRLGWIDQRSKTLGVGETITFQQWEWPPWVNRVMEGYKRHYWT